MSHFLDTNACIRHLNARTSGVAQRLAAFAPADIRLCDIVKAEPYYGAYRSVRREQNLAVLQAFFGQFLSLAVDAQSAQVFGRIRAELFAAGTPIGPYDMQIAAIALSHGLTLVTHNTREFGRVGGLRPGTGRLGGGVGCRNCRKWRRFGIEATRPRMPCTAGVFLFRHSVKGGQVQLVCGGGLTTALNLSGRRYVVR